MREAGGLWLRLGSWQWPHASLWFELRLWIWLWGLSACFARCSSCNVWRRPDKYFTDPEASVASEKWEASVDEERRKRGLSGAQHKATGMPLGGLDDPSFEPANLLAYHYSAGLLEGKRVLVRSRHGAL